MRPGSGAYGAGGEDDEGVGEFKKQIFRKSILFLKAACPNRTALLYSLELWNCGGEKILYLCIK